MTKSWKYVLQDSYYSHLGFILDNDGNFVADIKTLQNSTAHSNLEQNIRLMALAPEMLELLKEIMSWEENVEMTWGPKALEIIARAKGENV